MELAIFCRVQECLTNIHRHSGSKTAVIRIACEPDKIYAEVQDHGKGMSQERLAEVQSQAVGVGVGIRGMRERVRRSHGGLTVDGYIDYRYFLSQKHPRRRNRVRFHLARATFQNRTAEESAGTHQFFRIPNRFDVVKDMLLSLYYTRSG